jgi:hypothetical protein
MADQRRAPVQGNGLYHLRDGDPRKEGSHPPGTIAWWEHLKAWEDYHRRYPGQSAEKIAERCGFCYWELCDHLGHEPETWEPVKATKI